MTIGFENIVFEFIKLIVMLTVKPICKKSKARKDGTSVVFIQYCFDSNRRTLLNTGIAIPSNYWNEKVLKISDSLPTAFGMATELNKRIRDLIRKVEDIIDLGDRLDIQDSLTFVSKYFDTASGIEEITRRIKNEIELDNENNPRRNLDLYFQIDDYISSKSEKVTPGMLRIYRNMKEHLQAFEVYRKKKITFNSFDLDFYESFIDYLSFSYIQRRRKEVIYGLKRIPLGKLLSSLEFFYRTICILMKSIGGYFFNCLLSNILLNCLKIFCSD
jgi:hypothetical protein